METEGQKMVYNDHEIDPEKVYPEHEIRNLLKITERELRQAREAGELKYKQRRYGHRTYLGAWIIEWLGTPTASA